MKTINKISLFAAAGLLVAMTSCGNKDNWKPGQAVDPSSPKVYFDSSNTGEAQPEETTVVLTVSRVNTSEAITVPIKVINDVEGISLPANSVSFEAGQQTANFTVNFDSDVLQYEKVYPFTLEIDPAYSDPYDATIPGSSIYRGIKRVEPWTLIAEMNCTFEGRSGSKLAKFDPWKQNLYKKLIGGQFKIENWCLNGTGEWYGDLVFTVVDNKLIPDPDYGFHATAENRWYFYKPGAPNGDATEFQINGKLPTSTGVYMTYFYLYTVGSTDSRFAMDFNPETKTAKLGGYSRYSSSTFSSGAFYLHYTWE